MKKLLILLLTLPAFVFGQTQSAQLAYRITSPMGDSVKFSIIGVSGYHTLYDAAYINANFVRATSAGVTTFNGRSGHVTPISGDYSSFYYPLSGNPSGFLTSITSSNVTTALGFTPENVANKENLDSLGFLKTNHADSTYLKKINNLSDVASTTSSATNLGLGTGNTPKFSGSIIQTSGEAQTMYYNTNFTPKLRLGVIGNPEGNLTWNMDYNRSGSVGVHLPDDPSIGSSWFAMGSNGLFLQNAPGGIYTQTGVGNSTFSPGTGGTNGSYSLPASGGTGTGEYITITVAGGTITNAASQHIGQGYTIGDVLTATVPGNTGFSLTATTLYTDIWAISGRHYAFVVDYNGHFSVNVSSGYSVGDAAIQANRDVSKASYSGITDCFIDGNKTWGNAGLVAINEANTGDVHLGFGGGHVGIGAANTTYKFFVHGTTYMDNALLVGQPITSKGDILIQRTTTDLNGGNFVLNKKGTTGDTSSMVKNTAYLGTIMFKGWNGSTYSEGSSIRVNADEDFSGSATGTRMSFYQVPKGTTTPVGHLAIGSDGSTLFTSDVTGNNIYGANITTTLTSNANNATLAALVTTPTFVNGSFTGDGNYGIVTQTIVPSATGTYTNGSTNRVWLNGYFTNIQLGTAGFVKSGGAGVNSTFVASTGSNNVVLSSNATLTLPVIKNVVGATTDSIAVKSGSTGQLGAVKYLSITQIDTTIATGLNKFYSKVISGSYTTSATAQTTFTVTIGTTQSNTAYKVNLTPTDLLSTTAFYVTNKTTTNFDVVFISALTGPVAFDWALFK